MGVNVFVNNNRQSNRLVEIFYSKEYWMYRSGREIYNNDVGVDYFKHTFKC